MSLINDALKQAKQSQTAGSAAVGPMLRPAEPTRPTSGAGILLPMLLIAVLVVATVLLWQWFHPPLEVRAKSIPTASNLISAPASVPAALSAPSATPMVASPTTPAPVAMPVVGASTNAVATNTVDATLAAAPTVVAAEPPKPQPPAYKLQSIFYRPKSPSAVINGKTVYIGSRVGEMRVVSIDEESAELVNAAGQTNLLELP